MNLVALLLGQLTPEQILEAKRRARPSGWTAEAGAILAAIAVVTLFLVYWAVRIRKKKKRAHSLYHGERPERSSSSRGTASVDQAANRANQPAAAAPESRRRRRRRRREHRPRNPTLAETGGLPPVRPDEPPGAD